jgi:hypothetical protein
MPRLRGGAVSESATCHQGMLSGTRSFNSVSKQTWEKHGPHRLKVGTLRTALAEAEFLVLSLTSL